MGNIFRYLLSFLVSIAIQMGMQVLKAQPGFRWEELPSLPDSFGFAGSFAGVSNGALIVAGGANFPDGGAPWTGSTKVWSDKIFVLEKPSGTWRLAGKLPRALGYGTSITWKNKLICVGGSNSSGHFAGVFSITYKGGRVTFDSLPDLPGRLANSTGALSKNRIYIAGGLFKPESNTPANIFWTLDLSSPTSSRQWKELPTWPGPPRMLSVSGVSDESFFLFSGTNLTTKAGQPPSREYLNDAYAYSEKNGWRTLPDLPHAVVAAPNPAFSRGRSLTIFGGDDGKLAPKASVLKEQHPGFSDVILNYNTITDKWTSAGNIKTNKKKDAVTNPNGSTWSPVTTPMVIWKRYLVFPSGEVRPAVRTPRVRVAR